MIDLECLSPKTRGLLRGVISIITTVCMIFGAGADGKRKWVADALRGQQLSEKFCASCHIVRHEQSRSVVDGVPSFRKLAELPNQRISGELILPHTPMPNMQLTRNEIADILAFVEDLRRKATGKPPAHTTPRKKPKYPSPS